MSWGEQSCIKYGSCKTATYMTCNRKCAFYELNPGYKVMEDVKPEAEGGPQIVRSPNTTFNKREDMVVLGGKIFEIQSITPKKILLKYRQKMTKAKSGQMLPDGVFCFKVNGKVAEVAKVLRENKIRLAQDREVNANESSQK